ncbi:hypothetical protein [Massilia sp. TS11]|uniref:hypothetical protein n=1 Tax=Massilia sp. TS11 TaxID=2908003 RepID=UPI001EDA387F|nr:hypothetical protein [Massilia sp. TS11]MCG2584514.1 hypothetical protein [Massilia sp. TS11]
MLGLSRLLGRAPAPATLGQCTVALRLARCQLRAPLGAVLIGARGQTRRLGPGGLARAGCGEQLYVFHPGPYQAEIVPYAAAPELGLRLQLAVDSADPRQHQQRFDLLLASEAGAALSLAELQGRIEAAVRAALADGQLALPACATLAEWQQFRRGLDQLIYIRFGLTLDECLPCDLGARVDYAATLAARVPASAPAPAAAPAAAAAPDVADACALRRLFLELPALCSGVRATAAGGERVRFQQQQAVLRRLEAVLAAVESMPAVALAAPGQALAPERQAARAAHSGAAVAALDAAWAWLAQLQLAPALQLATLFQDGDRILARLETHCAARRAPA